MPGVKTFTASLPPADTYGGKKCFAVETSEESKALAKPQHQLGFLAAKQRIHLVTVMQTFSQVSGKLSEMHVAKWGEVKQEG